MCKVSAIITTHNRCDDLKRALKSVIQQTEQDLEIIVVVDNSTDNTMEYLSTVTDERLKVIYIDAAETKGGNYARNKGIQAASAPIIAFLDDDDIWFPEKIKRQLQVMEEENCGLCFCGHIDNWKRGKIRTTIIPDASISGDMSKRIFLGIFCTTSMLMARTDLIRQIGGFDESIKFWQEYDLCIRLCQITTVGCAAEPLMELMHDFEDSSRLSNKFFQWVDAVKEQNRRYAHYIDQLSEDDKKWRWRMIYQDAVIRCDAIHDRKRMRFYLHKIYKITGNKFDYFRYLFNISDMQRIQIVEFLNKHHLYKKIVR